MFRKVIIMIRKFIYATMMGGLLLGATACNTVKGAGRDLQSAADTTEKAIN
jgi:predicted small secreted protein